MLNMDVYNVVGFLIQTVSLIQSTVRHVPGYWPPENVCDFMLQNKALDCKVTMDAWNVLKKTLIIIFQFFKL